MGEAADAMIARASLRPWLAVVGSVLSFALLIETAGLIPAVIATVVVASRGSRKTALREALLFGVCLAVGMAVLFVIVLGQPFPLIRTW
jgi:hypothetical protein